MDQKTADEIYICATCKSKECGLVYDSLLSKYRCAKCVFKERDDLSKKVQDLRIEITQLKDRLVP